MVENPTIWDILLFIMIVIIAYLLDKSRSETSDSHESDSANAEEHNKN